VARHDWLVLSFAWLSSLCLYEQLSFVLCCSALTGCWLGYAWILLDSRPCSDQRCFWVFNLVLAVTWAHVIGQCHPHSCMDRLLSCWSVAVSLAGGHMVLQVFGSVRLKLLEVEEMSVRSFSMAWLGLDSGFLSLVSSSTLGLFVSSVESLSSWLVCRVAVPLAGVSLHDWLISARLASRRGFSSSLPSFCCSRCCLFCVIRL